MSDYSNTDNEEVDLGELIARLWSHFFLITVVTVFAIILGGYLALTAEKKFTAVAIFQINQPDNSLISTGSELGSLARIAGLSDGTNGASKSLLERIQKREFILAANKKTGLEKDPFFNNYKADTNSEDLASTNDTWKNTIKKFIGLKSNKIEPNIIIENNIVSKFKKFVVAETTNGNAISISVTHTNSKLAAVYANAFMEEIRELLEFERREALNLRLSYLSETLADALQEMELAQENLKEYTLRDSTLAQENFISGSLKLDSLRREKREVKKVAEVLKIIENLATDGNFDGKAYEKLRLTHPLIDDVNFRRILGMSETISAWSWPDLETIATVTATLRDRMKRLDFEVKVLENNAKLYAASAENLAKFTRDAKIAEATYTVLIEQVKSQTLAAGYRPEKFKVFEYATPPIGPSSPNRKLYLFFSSILGIIIGCSLALVIAFSKGTYYSSKALISDAKANLVLRSRSFARFSRWSDSKFSSYISKKQIVEVDEAEIRLSDKKLIYILNCGGRPTSSGTARLLATQSVSSGRNVILLDKSEKAKEGKATKEISGLPILTSEGKYDIVQDNDEFSSFTSSKFITNIKKLTEAYDQVFVCSNKHEVMLGLMALEKFNPSIVLLTRLQKTRQKDIRKIKANQPIDILFYD